MKYPFDTITDFMFFEHKLEKADTVLIPWWLRSELIEKAVELYKSWYASFILPSGGVSFKLEENKKTKDIDYLQKISISWIEWNYLKDIAVSLWVPEKVILKENKAKHTFDNANFSWKVLQEKNIKIKKCILVCKSYHARRALLTYQTAFPKNIKFIVCPIVDDKNITRDNWFLDQKKIEIVMKEVEKIGQYFWKHISNWVKK